MSQYHDKLDTIDTVYRCLLGRGLNAEERLACADVEFTGQQHAAALVEAVVRSDEFFMRHREHLFRKLIPSSMLVVARTPLGQELIVDLHQLHLGFSMAAGHYEPEEVAVLKNLIRRDMVVVDVGANIGFYTLMLAALVGDSGQVMAFEPVPDSRAKLAASVARNRLDHIVRIEPCALSDKPGTTRIVHDADTSNVGGAHMAPSSGGLPPGVVGHAVEMRCLDEFEFPLGVHFIKMDVEGAEGLVLRGGLRVLRTHRPLLMIEFNDAQLRLVSRINSELLAAEYRKLGYKLYRFVGGGKVAAVREPIGSEIAALLAHSGIFNALLIPEGGEPGCRHLIVDA